MNATMNAEHWRAAFVAELCSITSASPDEAEIEADKYLAQIAPAVPEEIDVVAHLGSAANAARATADRWLDDASGDLFEEVVDDLDSENVDPIPGDDEAPP